MSQEPDPSFRSHETGKPFVHCISCGLGLDDPDLPYLVAKSFHREECVFEYAICEHCRAHLSEEFSQESRERLAQFFDQHIDLQRRSRLLAFGPVAQPWIARCAACDTPRDEMEHYSLGAVLLGAEMLFDPYPLCLCGQCEQKIQETISKQTRDIWDDFVETHFDGPPAHVLDLPVAGKPMIL